VEIAVTELNYSPNPIARSLRGKTSSTIGMLVPDIGNPFFVDIIKGAQDTAFLNDMMLLLINSDEIWQNEKKMINMLISKKVDGILYLSAHLDIKATQYMDDNNIPYVLVNRNSANAHTSFVGLDNINGALIAVQHLIECGHTKIAHISGPLFTDTASGRLQGYHKALSMTGIKHRPEYIVESSFTYKGGFEAVKKLLELDDRPTAIFAANDLIAMGAIVGANEVGVTVPDSLSIIGFNDIWVASHFMPPLSTVYFDNYKMGSEACRMLIDIISDNKAEKQFILEPKLVVRNSTARLQ
jgi:DNA-binding LacI/PurR family transcriptional regulator